MDWQPIETAPMDGTYVLVAYRWGVTIAAHKNAMVWDKGETPHWIVFDCEDHFYSVHLMDENAPTHWMPLPEPPK